MKITLIFASIFTMATLFFGYTFIIRSNLNYNSEGNFFDEKLCINYNQQAVFIFGLIAFVMLFFAIIFILKSLKKK